MRVTSRHARPEDEEKVRTAIEHCKKQRRFAAGMAYMKHRVAEGQHIYEVLAVPEGLGTGKAREAVKELYQRDGVVHVGILVCPVDWF